MKSLVVCVLLLLAAGSRATAEEVRDLLVTAHEGRVWLSRAPLEYEPRLPGEADRNLLAKLRRCRGQKLNPAYLASGAELSSFDGRRIRARVETSPAARTARVGALLSPLRRELTGFPEMTCGIGGTLRFLAGGHDFHLRDAPPFFHVTEDVRYVIRAWVFDDGQALFVGVLGATRAATTYKTVEDGALVDSGRRVAAGTALWAEYSSFPGLFEVRPRDAAAGASARLLEADELRFGEPDLERLQALARRSARERRAEREGLADMLEELGR